MEKKKNLLHGNEMHIFKLQLPENNSIKKVILAERNITIKTNPPEDQDKLSNVNDMRNRPNLLRHETEILLPHGL